MVDLKHPGQGYFRTAGSLGWGFPAALGVKCALPDRPVVCFTGDGGFYYHIAELETARRHNINAVIVVNNNSSLNQEIRLNDAAYGGKQRGRAEEMWRFPDVDFTKVAEAFGCVGIRVTQPGELAGALKQAIGMNRPVVVDVVTDMYAIAKKPWVPGGAPDFHSFQRSGHERRHQADPARGDRQRRAGTLLRAVRQRGAQRQDQPFSEGHQHDRHLGVPPCPARDHAASATTATCRSTSSRRARAGTCASCSRPPSRRTTIPRTIRFAKPEHPPRKTEGGTWERGGQNLYTTRIHKSETLDYGILLSGERVLITDDGRRVLKPGDVVVQIGSWHAWTNPNDGSQMAFVMMGAKFDE